MLCSCREPPSLIEAGSKAKTLSMAGLNRHLHLRRSSYLELSIRAARVPSVDLNVFDTTSPGVKLMSGPQMLADLNDWMFRILYGDTAVLGGTIRSRKPK